jgi:hypothetical protein
LHEENKISMKITVTYKAFGSTDVSTDVFNFPSELIPDGMSVYDALEVVFRQCNHVDGTEWIEGKKLRSLSVDDQVNIDGVTYVCAGFGWEKKLSA